MPALYPQMVSYRSQNFNTSNPYSAVPPMQTQMGELPRTQRGSRERIQNCNNSDIINLQEIRQQMRQQRHFEHQLRHLKKVK